MKVGLICGVFLYISLLILVLMFAKYKRLCLGQVAGEQLK